MQTNAVRATPKTLLTPAVVICYKTSEVCFLCPAECNDEAGAISMKANLKNLGLDKKFSIRFRHGRIQIGRRSENSDRRPNGHVRAQGVFSWYGLYEEKYFPLVLT